MSTPISSTQEATHRAVSEFFGTEFLKFTPEEILVKEKKNGKTRVNVKLKCLIDFDEETIASYIEMGYETALWAVITRTNAQIDYYIQDAWENINLDMVEESLLHDIADARGLRFAEAERLLKIIVELAEHDLSVYEDTIINQWEELNEEEGSFYDEDEDDDEDPFYDDYEYDDEADDEDDDHS